MNSFGFFVFAAALITVSGKPFDNNVVLSLTPWTNAHLQFLSNLENQNLINLWNELRLNGSVHVMLNQLNSTWLVQLFESLNLKPQVMIPNVQKLFDDERRDLQIKARSGFARGVRDTFLNYNEIIAYLQQMATTYSSLVKLQSIGKTHENRDIWLIRITSPNGGTKKTAFLDFGIHAREWISPATGLYMIDELLSKYSAGGDAKTILDSWDLHIVPVLNPDGYAFSHSSSANRMWRKNRKPVGSGCYGVDLNRNFAFQWNTGGSSGSPCSDTFHGGSPASENEAKALQGYMTGKSWTTYLTFHSYGQWWFTNWGYTTASPPNFDLLKQKAQIGANAIRAVNGRQYTVGSSSQLLYVASGGSEDWTRGALNILYSYCLELPPTGGTGFVAPTSEIVKTGAETLAGVIAYLKAI